MKWDNRFSEETPKFIIKDEGARVFGFDDLEYSSGRNKYGETVESLGELIKKHADLGVFLLDGNIP